MVVGFLVVFFPSLDSDLFLNSDCILFCSSFTLVFSNAAETVSASDTWESTAVRRQASAIHFPHQLEARDTALKANDGLGSLKPHGSWGQWGANVCLRACNFYAEFFLPPVLHVLLWVQVSATAVPFLFFSFLSPSFLLQWHLFWGENAFLKVKLIKFLTKVTYFQFLAISFGFFNSSWICFPLLSPFDC